MADLDLAVSFARRGWEGARAWRENAISDEKGRVQHLKSICRATRDHLPFRAGPDAVESLPDVAMETTRRLTLAEGETKSLRGQRDDLVVELRRRTAELEEERAARAKAETELKTILAEDENDPATPCRCSQFSSACQVCLALTAHEANDAVDGVRQALKERGGDVSEMSPSEAGEYVGETIDHDRERIEKLEAEVAHLKAKRATDQAEAAKAREEVVRLDKELGVVLAARQTAITACRADLERPASLESRATRSLAWTVLLALDPTSARAEPEEAPEPRDLAAIGRDALVWAREMFGPEVDERPVARSSKVLEEAAELAQAEGLDAGRARRIVERVYSRPEGEPEHEGAQVAVTMAAWASARGLDLLALAAEEVDRIRRLDPKAVRAKHAEKARAGIAVGPTTAPEPEPTIDPGEGWRLLRAGEKIEKGDEVYFDEDDWFGSVDVGLIHLGEDDPPDMVRRRRIAAPPPAEPVAYPPSSAPEAVEVAPPQPAPVVCSADAASSEPRAQHPEQHEAPPALPAPRPVLPRPMPPELRAAIIRAQMAGGGS